MSNYKPDIVMYHDPCTDGITAAALVANWYRDQLDTMEFVPANYNNVSNVHDLIEQCRGKHLLMVDYTFKPDVLMRVTQSAASVVIIDHHESAQRALVDYHQQTSFDVKQIPALLEEHRVIAAFDMQHSGASLTEAVFYGVDKPSPFVSMVRTVDIHLDHTNPRVDWFKYWARSQPATLANWQQFVQADARLLDTYIAEGAAIQRYASTNLDQLEANATRWGQFPTGDEQTGALRFKWAISDYAFSSDLCNRYIDNDVRLGIVGYFTSRGLGFSLRSRKDFACNRIAEQFGGGGHPQSAGFLIPYEDLPDFVNSVQEMGYIDLSDPRFAQPENSE